MGGGDVNSSCKSSSFGSLGNVGVNGSIPTKACPDVCEAYESLGNVGVNGSITTKACPDVCEAAKVGSFPKPSHGGWCLQSSKPLIAWESSVSTRLVSRPDSLLTPRPVGAPTPNADGAPPRFGNGLLADRALPRVGIGPIVPELALAGWKLLGFNT